MSDAASGTWRTTRRRLMVILMAGVLALLVLPAAPGGAVAPGANGRLACEGGRPDADGVMRPQVYTINPDGTGEQILTDLPTRDGDPSWSPDGTKIAFESFRDDGSEVYVMNADDGSGVTRLTFNGPPEDRGTNWSADGSQIVFHSARFPAAEPGPGHSALEIFIMDADGSNQTRLTENNFQDALADISPQGRIVFNTNRDLDHEIYDMNVDGTDQRRLTFSPGEDAHPIYSPDGSKIAFHSRRTGPLNIFVMDADGSNVTQITHHEDTHAFFPVWSPDSTKIAYTGNTLNPAQFDVYVMDADGSNVVQVTDSPGFDGRCDWGVATPRTKDECKKNGWREFNIPTHERFRNQGQCASWVNESQRNRL